MTIQHNRLLTNAFECLPTDDCGTPLLGQYARDLLVANISALVLRAESTQDEQFHTAVFFRALLGATGGEGSARSTERAEHLVQEARARLKPIPPMQLSGYFSVELRKPGTRDFTTVPGLTGLDTYEEAVRMMRALPQGKDGYRIVAIVSKDDI